MSRTPSVLDRPTPKLGAHTEEVLGEIGYSKDDIAGFRRGKVV
jgi:crotonobetainyl-CoA:carnitine CoA-transferase CaiB-like acyl-CoA transferase